MFTLITRTFRAYTEHTPASIFAHTTTENSALLDCGLRYSGGLRSPTIRNCFALRRKDEIDFRSLKSPRLNIVMFNFQVTFIEVFLSEFFYLLALLSLT